MEDDPWTTMKSRGRMPSATALRFTSGMQHLQPVQPSVLSKHGSRSIFPKNFSLSKPSPSVLTPLNSQPNQPSPMADTEVLPGFQLQEIIDNAVKTIMSSLVPGPRISEISSPATTASTFGTSASNSYNIAATDIS